MLILVGIVPLKAQILEPAKWSTATSKSSVNAGDEIDLLFNVKIDPDWYLYSSEFPCEDGPIKTTFNFQPNDGYQLVGGIVPVNPVDKYDDIFECDVKILRRRHSLFKK